VTKNHLLFVVFIFSIIHWNFIQSSRT